MSRIKRLLDSMNAGLFTAEDVAADAGMTECEVLAALRVLEELGIVEPAGSDGCRRAYRMTRLGEKLRRALALAEGLALEEAGGEVSRHSRAALTIEGSD